MEISFQEFLATFNHLQTNAIAEIERAGVKKTVKSGTDIFQSGSPFFKLLFLEEGLIRAYRIVDGKDITFFFFTAGEFAVDYESFLLETDSSLFFETLVDSRYVEFNKSTITSFYNLYPEFERVGRIMAEKAYLSSTKRLKEFQAESLEKRYVNLLQRSPKLFQQVPQYHIASYLGVSPQSLSRIRAKMQNKFY